MASKERESVGIFQKSVLRGLEALHGQLRLPQYDDHHHGGLQFCLCSGEAMKCQCNSVAGQGCRLGARFGKARPFHDCKLRQWRMCRAEGGFGNICRLIGQSDLLNNAKISLAALAV